MHLRRKAVSYSPLIRLLSTLTLKFSKPDQTNLFLQSRRLNCPATRCKWVASTGTCAVQGAAWQEGSQNPTNFWHLVGLGPLAVEGFRGLKRAVGNELKVSSPTHIKRLLVWLQCPQVHIQTQKPTLLLTMSSVHDS